ncbi:hypothetical protein Tcan_05318 [Toxocara canis]|uniref:Uncharacterized protein n=1 Tax=Toxocara canis TaxID=6265 RepID=A0A0B2W6R2_TOXCA|nr:hypothetical protein Tcan_05318 [Toxocara canis]
MERMTQFSSVPSSTPMRSIARITVVIVMLIIMGFVVADDCSSEKAHSDSIKNYVACLKRVIGENRKLYEAELHTHIRSVTKRCFERKISNGSCDLPDVEFGTVLYDGGAKSKGCLECGKRTVDETAGGQFIRPQDSICLRSRVTEQIVHQVEQCMSPKKIGSAAFRSFANPDTESTNITTQVSNSILDYMTIYTRLATCALSNESRAQIVANCVEESLHDPSKAICNFGRSCESAIPDACKDSLNTVRKSFCECLSEVQTSRRKHFMKIGEEVEKVLSKYPTKNITVAISTCVSTVKTEISKGASNWLDDIGSAFLECTPKARSGPPSTEILLNAACSAVAAQGISREARQLTPVLTFVSAYLDAVGDRLRVICSGPCA